jgi:glyoxylase-like metal-dependent hydrolase (beta-lactamase superfamily II)
MDARAMTADVALVRAPNPGPYTLGGTNTWLLGREPAWVVDPGPDLGGHLDAVAAEAMARGGLGGVALTHDHADHAGGVAGLLARLGPAPVGAARYPGDVRLGDGDAFGPLRALPVPGHAPDHLVLVAGDVAFTGDAVLGEGSVFVAPGPGSLRGYLAGLERLRALGLRELLPGHGPRVRDPAAKLDEYLAHRRERERALLAALAGGARTPDALLAAAWPEVPAPLREAALATLAAHLGKLEEEGRLPRGVEVPRARVPGGEG